MNESEIFESPIYSEAGGRKAKRLRWDPKALEIVLAKLRERPSEELHAWVESAAKVCSEWHSRNMRNNAGEDLLNANRGMYDFQATISVVRAALAVVE